MANVFTRIIRFFRTDIWSLPVGGDMRQQRRWMTLVLKTMLVAGRHFVRKNMFARDVPALTYSTLMAIVPILALFFTIAKSVGSNVDLSQWIMNTFNVETTVAHTIGDFVANYLEHTKSGYIVSTGIIMMLYTIFSLMQKIERTFNHIWHTPHERSWWRMLTDYSFIFLFLALMILISSAAFLVLGSMAETLDQWLQTGTLARRSLAFTPYVALCLLFFVLFKAMPSPRVHWRTAIIPSILSGVAMAALQYYYFKLQVGLASYNVIYGSFAAIPLFLLWLNLSWAICLYGVELCYAIQNLNQFDYNMDVYDLSHEQHKVACAIVMKHVCQHYLDDQHCYTASQLQRASALPQQLVDYCLVRLTEINLLHVYRDKHHDMRYTPAINIYELNVALLVQRLEEQGRWQDRPHVIQVDSPKWQELTALRGRYLNDCKNILLMDL